MHKPGMAGGSFPSEINCEIFYMSYIFYILYTDINLVTCVKAALKASNMKL